MSLSSSPSSFASMIMYARIHIIHTRGMYRHAHTSRENLFFLYSPRRLLCLVWKKCVGVAPPPPPQRPASTCRRLFFSSLLVPPCCLFLFSSAMLRLPGHHGDTADLDVFSLLLRQLLSSSKRLIFSFFRSPSDKTLIAH